MGRKITGRLKQGVSDGTCFIIFKVFPGYCVKPVLVGDSVEVGEPVRDAYNHPGKP